MSLSTIMTRIEDPEPEPPKPIMDSLDKYEKHICRLESLVITILMAICAIAEVFIRG